jgi:hypothetical protein
LQVPVLFKIVFQELFSSSSWKNIDEIIKIQDEYDLKSTFFWLTEKGKDKHGVPQADYSLAEVEAERRVIRGADNFDSGLHKSTFSKSFEEELSKADDNWTMNRYHFLKFNPYPDWSVISNSKIRLDASLGFSEHFGFRNSFGSPFIPYDVKNGKRYDFVEVPLSIMDMTFKNYLKIPAKETASVIINFIEENRTNSVLSLLWHNTFFTNYKFGAYLNVYKEIAAYLYESKFPSVTGSEILIEYGRDQIPQS